MNEFLADFSSLRQIRYPDFEYLIVLLKAKALFFNDCGFGYVKKLAWEPGGAYSQNLLFKPFENFDTKRKK